MSDLSGPFEELKGLPILSGIFTSEGVKRLDQFMMNLGFMTKHKVSMRALKKSPPPGTPRRDAYVIRAYEYPQSWDRRLVGLVRISKPCGTAIRKCSSC